ncbi:MAG TPA: DNA translocase FtsK [Verrucomicrobiae bacterium]
MNKYQQAKAKLPLRKLMEQYGDAPGNGSWASMPRCPFCGKKGSAGVFESKGTEFFKCFKTDCPSGTAGENNAVSEIGYVAIKESLSAEAAKGEAAPAYKRYLELAGLWEEPKAKTAKPGAAKFTEEQVTEALEIIRSEQKASVSLLQRRMKLGYTLCAMIMDELERRHVVGPSKGSEPRDILLENPVIKDNLPEGVPAPTPVPPEAASSGSGDAASSGVRKEDKAPLQSSMPRPLDVVDAGSVPPEDVVPDAEGGEGDDQGLVVLRRFYSQLVLRPEDLESIMAKRGLSESACVSYGFRSNGQSNLDILHGLRGEFPEEALIASGLFLADERQYDLKPNSQFYGYGMAGKDAQGNEVWEWNNPILIPYWDASGRLIYLRPHKGGVKGFGSRLYVARAGGVMDNRRFETLVICEGEFKADAGDFVFSGSKVGWCALPGISQSKNPAVWSALIAYIREVNPKHVIVGFDSEEKGDPALASFKPDKKKRYDAIIWARYLAEKLARDGWDGRVCLLPKEWRDEKGKADWDGVLARWLKEEKPLEQIRHEWSGLLRVSPRAADFRQRGLFDNEDERIIRNGLMQLWYKPALPHAGDRERRLAQKLKRLANTTLKYTPGVEWLAEKYHEVVGWYYTLKDVPEKRRISLQKELVKARKEERWDEVWFLDLQLEGIPAQVADFRMDLRHVLVRSNGKRDRILDIRNAQGEKVRRAALDARSMVRPSEFREWLGNTKNLTWMAGERELQALQRDLNHAALDLEVHEVPFYGFHEASGVWFAGDCAVTPEGDFLRPDNDGVFWYDGLGYLVPDKDEENETFRQKAPTWRPELNIAEMKFEYSGLSLFPGEDPDSLGDWPATQKLGRYFREFTERMRETLGGYESYMAVGMMLAYAAAPEIFRQYGGFPGLWVHGQMGQGKTSITRWLMDMHGFSLKEGLNLRTACTQVGMLIAAQQYSNLGVWFEEFRNGTVDSGREGVLHASFNRDRQSKKTADGRQRQIRSSFLVTGESTCSDAATRDRYAHVFVSEPRRKGQHREWFERNRDRLVLFFREVLRNRKEFAASVLREMKSWMALPDLKSLKDRPRLVHGVAHAGFRAAVAMFQSHAPDEMMDFRNFLFGHSVTATEDVQSRVNINVFMQHIISAYQRGVFGETENDKKRYFKVKTTPVAHPPNAPKQGAWMNYHLYLNHLLVVDTLSEHLRRSGRTVPLEISDLRDQLAQNEFWVGPSTQRFAGKNSKCWEIDLDRFPDLGYKFVDEEELEASRWRDSAHGPMRVVSDDWVDPRKGSLFSIVEELSNDQQTLA